MSSPPVIQGRCEGTPGLFVLADTCRHVLNVTDLTATSASWKVLPKQTFLLPFKLCQANFVMAFLLLD